MSSKPMNAFMVILRMLQIFLLLCSGRWADSSDLSHSFSSSSILHPEATYAAGKKLFLRHSDALRSMPSILQHPLATGAPAPSSASSSPTSSSSLINNNHQNVLQLVNNIDERLKQMRRSEMRVTAIQVMQ